MNCSPNLNSQQKQERPDWYVLPVSIEKVVSAYIRGRALSTIGDEAQSQRFEINSDRLGKAGIDPKMNNVLAGFAAFHGEDLEPSLIQSLQAHCAFESEEDLKKVA